MSCQRCGKVTCSLRYGCETSYDLGVRDGIEKGRAMQQDLEYLRGSADGEAVTIAAILGVNATPRDAAELARILEARHKGTERGELQALLVRLWGESPRIRLGIVEAVGEPNEDGLIPVTVRLDSVPQGEFMDERAENIDRLDARRILADVETHVGTPSRDRILSEAEREIVHELGRGPDLLGLAACESQPPLPRVHSGLKCVCEDPAYGNSFPCSCDCHGPVVSGR